MEKGTTIKLMVNVSLETTEAQRQWNDKELKGKKYYYSKILYLAKLFFKNGRLKQKDREFVASILLYKKH